MDTRGILATADVWLNEPMDCLAIEQAVKNMLKQYTVMAEASHLFNPHGLTAVWVLAESHCALHTYPEHNYFSIDLYTCTDKLHPEESLLNLIESLPFKEYQLDNSLRGVK